MLHRLLVAVGVTDDAGALCGCAARFVRLLLSMVESAAFCELACRLGAQMFADFPQMLAYARSPPNFGGLTADEKKTDFGVGVYDHKAAQLVWVFFVVVVTDDGYV